MLTILGNGQLAMMIAQAAASIGQDSQMESELGPEFLEPLENGQGLVTFENEFLPAEILNWLDQKQIDCFPNVSALAILQNKLNQKILFGKFGLPTADYRIVATADEVKFPCVLKWSRQGYDGKGVMICRNSPSALQDFFDLAVEKGSQVYQEDLTEFQYEAAFMVVRNQQGEVFFYPMVHSVQKSGTCHYVFGTTIENPQPDPALSSIQESISKILSKLNYVGAMGVELFVLNDGTILINEIAPRVHNSGHYTMAVSDVSQFEAHVRAGINQWKKPTLKSNAYFLMWNILGPELEMAYEQEMDEGSLPKMPEGAQLTWYKKSKIRSKRKMGHVNFVFQTESEGQAMISTMKQWDQKFQEQIKVLAGS